MTQSRTVIAPSSPVTTLPTDLLLLSLSFLTMHERGEIASTSSRINNATNHFLFWNLFLKPKHHSNLSGVAKHRFINDLGTRLPKFIINEPETKLHKFFKNDKTSKYLQTKRTETVKLIEDGLFTEEQHKNCTSLSQLIALEILTMKEAATLNHEEAENLHCLQGLIIRDIVTVDYAKHLSADEREKLKDERIQILIMGSFLTVDQALELTSHELPKVAEYGIRELIENGKLTIDQAKKLTEAEWLNLSGYNISKLIIKGILSVDEAKLLTPQERDNLTDSEIQELIEEQIITLDQAKLLTSDQMDFITSDVIHPLILNKTLAVNEAIKFSTGFNPDTFLWKNLNDDNGIIRYLIENEQLLYPKQNSLTGESKEEAKPTVVASTVINSCSSSSSLTAPSYGSLFATKMPNTTTAPEESVLTVHLDSLGHDIHKKVVNFWCDSDALAEEISRNRLRPS